MNVLTELDHGRRPRRRQLTPHRVDRQVARDVAGAFLTAASTPRAAHVQAAYRRLGEQATAHFARLTDDDAPQGVRVRFTSVPLPYHSAAELSAAVRIDRVLEVTASRVERDRSHPLLDCSVGGEYDRFRAVHDIVSHGWGQLGFDRDGEYTAWIIEDGMYRGLARWALATELHAEHSVRWTTGGVADHKAVLLAPALIARSRCGAPAARAA